MKNQVNPFSQSLTVWQTCQKAENLPKWEELPLNCQQELIQTLAALLMQQPELQAVLEVRREPEH
jgi:hypothetical protein